MYAEKKIKDNTENSNLLTLIINTYLLYDYCRITTNTIFKEKTFITEQVYFLFPDPSSLFDAKRQHN